MRSGVLVVASVAIAALSSVAAPGVARAVEPEQVNTANWAGHLASRAPAQPAITGSAMRLEVPAVSCTAGLQAAGPAMVSIWNGLGGWHGDVLYQAGVEATCAPGNDTAQYDAFYEVVRPGGWPGTDVFPHTVVTPLATHTVVPGDVITSRVQVTGGAARFDLTDTTPGTRTATATVRWRASVATPVAATDAAPRSAECIVERAALTDPAGRTSLAPLADFHAAFNSPLDSCTGTDTGRHTAAIAATAGRWTQITINMRDASRSPRLATARFPSAAARRALTVLWNRSA